MPPKYEPLAADDGGDDGGPACVRWDQARWWDAMYSWVTPLIALGTTRQLRHTDLPELPPKMRIGRAIEDLRGGLDGSRLAREAEDCLGARTDGPKAPFPDGSLLGVIFYVYWRQQLQSLGFEFCREGCAVLVTVAMRRVILFMEDADRPPWEGYMLVSLASFSSCAGSGSLAHARRFSTRAPGPRDVPRDARPGVLHVECKIATLSLSAVPSR